PLQDITIRLGIRKKRDKTTNNLWGTGDIPTPCPWLVPVLHAHSPLPISAYEQHTSTRLFLRFLMVRVAPGRSMTQASVRWEAFTRRNPRSPPPPKVYPASPPLSTLGDQRL
ncbi:unnamed protein product, partial [Ectocarpus fasciculatus]